MTVEELNKHGYSFVVIHGCHGVTVCVRFKALSSYVEFERTFTRKLREPAIEAARESAMGHFVEMRLAQSS